jgi:hypothetical protein
LQYEVEELDRIFERERRGRPHDDARLCEHDVTGPSIAVWYGQSGVG